ncbi:RDD family protein, partial [Candidatus Omnitrophota bacterium]
MNKIETKENESKLEKDSALASTNKRFLNFILDILIALGLYTILIFILAILGLLPDSYFANENSQIDPIWLLFAFFYFYLFEIKFQRTPAKFITKTKVLDINGYK